MALPRLDSYGKPLPALTDARQEVLYDRPINAEQRRHLLADIEALLRAYCCRGMHVRLHISLDIQDGFIQETLRYGSEETRVYKRDG